MDSDASYDQDDEDDEKHENGDEPGGSVGCLGRRLRDAEGVDEGVGEKEEGLHGYNPREGLDYGSRGMEMDASDGISMHLLEVDVLCARACRRVGGGIHLKMSL